jgi:hypothetical protein
MSRTFVEPHPSLKEVLPRQYAEVVARYGQAVQRALPGITQVELQWRLNFVFSAIFNAFAGNNILRLVVQDPVVNARDPQRIAAFLLPFVVAGLTAPLAAVEV